MKINTGIKSNNKFMEILNSTIGQMSDGLWENSNSMKKYWQSLNCSVDPDGYIIIEDRFDAIRQAIEMVNVDDTILILGKGDEDFIYRSFGKEKYMGDDKVARRCIHK